jgi:hypothetical protein
MRERAAASFSTLRAFSSVRVASCWRRSRFSSRRRLQARDHLRESLLEGGEFRFHPFTVLENPPPVNAETTCPSRSKALF